MQGVPVLLPKAKAAITVVVHSGAHFVSDSPNPKFLPELLAMVPSARYIQTTREPKVWAKSRISQHRHLLNLPLCKPEWVNVTSSYFNVFECVAAAGDAITRSGADEEVHCSRQIISGPGTRIRELLVDLRTPVNRPTWPPSCRRTSLGRFASGTMVLRVSLVSR